MLDYIYISSRKFDSISYISLLLHKYMDNAIRYQGKQLGTLLMNYNLTMSATLVTKDLASLEKLLSLHPNAVIKFHDRSMRYGKFRKKYMKELGMILPSEDAHYWYGWIYQINQELPEPGTNLSNWSD